MIQFLFEHERVEDALKIVAKLKANDARETVKGAIKNVFYDINTREQNFTT